MRQNITCVEWSYCQWDDPFEKGEQGYVCVAASCSFVNQSTVAAGGDVVHDYGRRRRHIRLLRVVIGNATEPVGLDCG